jgi:hypothetical protein
MDMPDSSPPRMLLVSGPVLSILAVVLSTQQVTAEPKGQLVFAADFNPKAQAVEREENGQPVTQHPSHHRWHNALRRHAKPGGP